jgi:ADP-heptose:LPS heptosyltransferase
MTTLTINLANLEPTHGGHVDLVVIDIAETIATLKSNLDQTLIFLSDRSLQSCLEFFDAFPDRDYALVIDMLNLAISALIARQVRCERNRRIRENAANTDVGEPNAAS